MRIGSTRTERRRMTARIDNTKKDTARAVSQSAFVAAVLFAKKWQAEKAEQVVGFIELREAFIVMTFSPLLDFLSFYTETPLLSMVRFHRIFGENKALMVFLHKNA